MRPAGPIGSVIVAGGGITAWSAAAALKRRIPSLQVALIVIPLSAGALADRMISTLPSIHGFHQDIGLTAADTIGGAASDLRLGTLFEGWADELAPYVHAYGAYGTPVGGVSFHQLWLRDHQRASLPPFDYFSPAAELARSGRPPTAGSDSVEFGLQLTLDRYGELMRAYALHLGVTEHRMGIQDVELRTDDGFIDKLTLDDGTSQRADLYVDCTGPEAILHSRFQTPLFDWSKWLPCDRLIMTGSEANAAFGSMDRVTAFENGWRWAASSPQQSSSGTVYSSAHASDSETLGEAGEPIAFRQGRLEDFWVRNCVALGDAAVMIEPLEWTNLHLVHSQIDRMVSMMPARDCAPIELAEFNRQCAAEADRVRDFVCLHYVCARRPERFWKDAAAVAPPDSLAHSLSLFAERGRLPYHEEETFSRDSWLAVLLGQGFEPRRIDPMADLVPPAEAQLAFATMRRSLESFTLPLAADILPELNPRGVR